MGRQAEDEDSHMGFSFILGVIAIIVVPYLVGVGGIHKISTFISAHRPSHHTVSQSK
jgi:hypothetical protein